MGRSLVLLSCALCLACGVFSGNRATEYLEPDLAQWDGEPRFWTVVDGVLVGESTAQVPCTETTYLVWGGEPVHDFELSFKVRIAGGNSGVQFRSREVTQWRVEGPQADLDAQNRYTGILYEQGGRGIVATRGQSLVFDAQGVQQTSTLAQPVPQPSVGPQRFSAYVIRAQGDRVTFVVDGVTTIEVVDPSLRANSAGRIALQLHQGEPMRVEYTDLRLRRLTQVPATQPEPTTQTENERQWIWCAEARDGQEVWFRHSFELASAPKTAALWASCDNALEFYVNGQSVLGSDEWEVPTRVDVAQWLVAGRNELAVWARNDGGPAGLIVELDLGTETLASNGTWRCRASAPPAGWEVAAPDDAWQAVREYGALGVQPWGRLQDARDPAQAAALPAERVEVEPGFEVDLVYSVPRVRQGSWVSLCADASGRLYAADQYGGLYRIDPRAQPARVERVPVELGEAQGLLWAFDALYVVVCAAGSYTSGLYRVRDTDGDDQLDRVEALLEFKGSGEHGPHAVVLGPERESLYVVAGNHTELPELAASRVPQIWAEDLLLQRIEDPGGHAVGKRAPGGWIVRTDADGSEVELVAMGFRNPYDIAFDAHGELFTFDADMEWDVGLPWYRPTRILHVTSGAEFGWRSGSGKWPAYYPDSLPAAVEVGLTSPTGICFGTQADFPQPWRDVLFAADWAYGTIYAIDLEPRGASFVGSARPFVRGEPLPVTDLAVASDGHLYFTAGGRRAQSGLYRVRATSDAATSSVREPALAHARLERRALEERHLAPGADDVDAALRALGHADRHVRFAARTVLERAPAALWRERVLDSSRAGDAALEGALALVRADPNVDWRGLRARLLAWPWESFTADQLLAGLRVYGLALIRLQAQRPQASALDARLLALLPHADERCNRELVRLLARRAAAGFLERALDLLEGAASQEAAIDYAYALAHVREEWTDATRARFLGWFDRVAESYAGGASFERYLQEIRRRATSAMGVSLNRSSADTPAEFAPDPDEPALTFVRDYALNELTPSLVRLAAGRDFEQGRALYRRTSCLQCHRMAGAGGATGPDLTGTAGRYSPRDLLEALLEPSAVVSDQYRDTEVWTTAGNVADEPDHVAVRTAQGERRQVARDEVELVREHPLSRMPEGLIDGLQVEQILDLLAYVLAGGDPQDAAFRPALDQPSAR